ncbi:MAG: dihydroorotate dehydrogenase [Omnitrophica bacterium RIFCSPLOWO2_12_FULL_44_17]|uniref:Dihydroorotate dehydrogenase n=1 Tax=Candidatus Danuiimicrobium aquiferis TaxID=1801832 RepID=A0A1G1L2Y3_9BACT|nr:MAG: dihydroorotate dehydrogenase [Omnitrophica bacterium RIFCSPHIGHO2_02_FULL_45_28]OGW99515.1 MAG: dihydroorotate dehydrogenase [Omnitrophica bacterium RIFCSPLOWO2_12_FULL_44_17]OGX02688.1 MAG: dihydroorotate dehydrogenase [Omnitrophica bacterium RIFCSPLOWO2_02_FULL_44_11]
MDLSTTYLGFKLKTPLVVSASPLCEGLNNIKKAEDAGASAVVLRSLFEEQLTNERFELDKHLTENTDSFSEATSFFPEASYFNLGPEEYLETIRKAKANVNIPIIASLNGATEGGWIDFSKKIEQAGADALEMNIYYIATNPNLPSQVVEKIYFDILKEVKAAVKIPVAVKVSPFFSNMAYMAKGLADAGANGLVLFNRFYQPDINIETLEVSPLALLSTPQAFRLPLRWIGILYGKIKTDFAASGGIHTAADVIKMMMVGANVAMLCSVLLRHGVHYIRTIEKEMEQWMTENEYESVSQMRGSMSQIRCEEPSEYERAQYVRVLQSYKADAIRVK